MRTINRLSLVIMVTVLMSCSLDDYSGPEYSFYRIKTQKNYFPDLTFDEVGYSYDSIGRVTKKESYNNKGEIIYTEKFFYDEEYLVKIERGVNNTKESELKYTYQNFKLKAEEYWAKDSVGNYRKDYERIFEYNGNFLKKVTSNYVNGAPDNYALYFYENENIVSIKSYSLSTNELLEEDQFKYDKMPNPFYKESPQYVGHPIASSRNNLIYYKIIATHHIPSPAEMSFEYSYNSDNYPAEKFIKGTDGKKYLEEAYDYALYYYSPKENN